MSTITQQTARQAFSAYRGAVRQTHASGQATEHSYRPALKSLIEALGDGVEAINEPRRAEASMPDFIVQSRDAPIGHIECKDIGENLAATAMSEQLQRYREALPNLILTDYLEFHWYVEGDLRDTARLGRFDRSGKYTAESGGGDAVGALLDAFFNAEQATVSDPADLARRMAGKTRLLRESIRRILQEEGDEPAALGELLTSYREVLISDLDADEFADLQAQTAAYGLFAARCLHDGPGTEFTRQSAVFMQTTPFLRDVLTRIAGPAADPSVAWIVDDLALLLARADMDAILDNFGRRAQQDDPVVHFYEDFLTAYDPKLRELRGVYYTPDPVVSYIVRSVDRVLRDDFGLVDGLADTATVEVEVEVGKTRTSPRVLILDPAAGTGTFLREVVSIVRQTIKDKGLGGAWPDYVRKHLLPRLFGFELLMAPYAICHLKLALEIGGEDRAFALPADERLSVFLTNSLEEAHEAVTGPMFAAEIAREARKADAIKRDHPVMVVSGNPPYSGHSANKGKWIRDLLHGRVEGAPESYFSVDGEPLGERNPKWLNDDYVKFIRFAQQRIEHTGYGVLGFVTNHSYLDNPTFRGMRQSLMTTFDEIRLLDLHGNTKKHERAPGDEPDENVFDIQQGVAISIFVKHADSDDSDDGPTRVLHADLWGERETENGGGKYEWLSGNDIATTDWTPLEPKEPHYLFVPRDEALADEYNEGWKLTDVLPVNSVGIATARDKLAIQWTADDMRRVAADFAALTEPAARERYRLGRDTGDWKVLLAQADVHAHPDAETATVPILYRPFDARYTYYTGQSRGFICRPRQQIMRHMLAGTNIGLSTTRGTEIAGGWEHVFVSRYLTQLHTVSSKEVNYLFPLYIYPPEGDALELGIANRTSNLDPTFIEELAAATGLRFITDGTGDLNATFGPEDVFRYIYAVLHSPEYRRRYADFLKSDFPLIPLPRNGMLFAELARLGANLTSLHLMEADGADLPAFNVEGHDRVERVHYTAPSDDAPGHVWFNGEQHFEGISPETWALTIGGYRPAQKWLQDRKGRTLSFDDIDWYQRVCAALAETPRVMLRIDEAIAAQGGWPLDA